MNNHEDVGLPELKQDSHYNAVEIKLDTHKKEADVGINSNEVSGDAKRAVVKSKNGSTIEEPLFGDTYQGSSQDDLTNNHMTVVHQTFVQRWFHKGNISNFISGTVMVIGFILTWAKNIDDVTARYVLSVGLFGFAGGITNWLAVKMLFDKIPFLYGSGVIPRRFKEIRQTVKDTIMVTFFDEEYLEGYLKNKFSQFDLESKLVEFMDDPNTSKLIDTKLEEAFGKPEVQMLLTMMNLESTTLIPLLKPFIISMGKEIAPMIKEKLIGGKSIVNIHTIRNEIDKLMEAKLQLLTAPTVKKLMEQVMRKHLSWLIIWGNFFGGLIGLVSAIVNVP